MELARKLQLKAGSHVALLGAPPDLELHLPDDIPVTTDANTADAVVAFVHVAGDLDGPAAPVIDAARVDKLSWLAYPRAGQLGTDLNRDRVASAVRESGVQPVRQISIDDVWSALRLRLCDQGDLRMQTLYEAAGGADGLLRLAKAWHARVMADEVVSHAFSHGFHPDHTQRLAAYWAEALGGPTTYTDRYGDETSVVRMHSGNGPHEEMDRRAIACFDRALADVGLADARLLRVLHDYFAWATTTTMSRYHASPDDVPDGLRVPRWSWDGLVRV